MITFAQAQAQVLIENGLDQYPKKPREQYAYFAYKNGKAFEFATSDEARKVSNMMETVVVNQEEIDEYLEFCRKLEHATRIVWNASLREEYSYLSENVYNICYNEAYDRGHHEGYDEVANYMINAVEFANKIIKAAKE